jgi:hypothetical protein
MRKFFLFILLTSQTLCFSQKKVLKKLQTNADEINIYTKGLDNIILENSSTGFLEIALQAESYDDQLIKIEQQPSKINVKFDFEGTQTREVIFRKFITKRLQRASAIVKIPKNKKVYIFGENVDIESVNYNNDLAIYIDNGIVKLNTIQSNVILKLYSGNVYAKVKSANINVISNTGKIEIDDVLYQKKYNKVIESKLKEVSITSIKANIFLTTQ